MNHLFEKFDYIKLMIYHSVNKSVADLLLRILFIDIPFIDAKMTLFLEQRKEILVLLLELFDRTEDYEVLIMVFHFSDNFSLGSG